MAEGMYDISFLFFLFLIFIIEYRDTGFSVQYYTGFFQGLRYFEPINAPPKLTPHNKTG